MKAPHSSIAEIAYELWEARGMPHGSAEQDWAEAERIASQSSAAEHSTAAKSAEVDESSIESFPASDAPASRVVDAPPSNADAKWAAAGARKKRVSKR